MRSITLTLCQKIEFDEYIKNEAQPAYHGGQLVGDKTGLNFFAVVNCENGTVLETHRSYFETVRACNALDKSMYRAIRVYDLMTDSRSFNISVLGA